MVREDIDTDEHTAMTCYAGLDFEPLSETGSFDDIPGALNAVQRGRMGRLRRREDIHLRPR